MYFSGISSGPELLFGLRLCIYAITSVNVIGLRKKDDVQPLINDV